MRRLSLIVLIVFAGLPSCVAPLFAESVLAPPESAKIITEDAFTTPRGSTEVEFSGGIGVVEKAYDSSGNPVDRPDVQMTSLALTVSYGLLDRLDASVGAVGLKLVTDETNVLADDVGNVRLNLKWAFLGNASGTLLLSWLPGITAPVGSGASDFAQTTILQNFWSIDNLLAFTAVGKRFNLSADGGFSLPLRPARGERNTIFVADAAVGYQLFYWLQPVVELNYANDFVQGPEKSASILSMALGAVFNLGDWLRFDLGAGYGVIGQRTDHLTTATANLALIF